MAGVYTLIYTSDAAVAMTDIALVEVMSTARRHNDRVGITGVLIYKERQFIQVLEGARETVEATFDRITADARHEHIRVVHRGHHPQRAYGDWSMKLERPQETAFARAMGFVEELMPVEGEENPALELRALI